jgi:probable rRNA maturation factor
VVPRHRVDVRIERPFGSAVSVAWLRSVARRVLAAERPGEAIEASVVVADDTTVRDLNCRYRGRDEPTDVLSFGLGDSADASFVLPPDERSHLGEVVISCPTAVRQAEEEGHSVEAELAHLLVHGILHLLGYNDEEPEDERIMREREAEILAELEPKTVSFRDVGS